MAKRYLLQTRIKTKRGPRRPTLGEYTTIEGACKAAMRIDLPRYTVVDTETGEAVADKAGKKEPLKIAELKKSKSSALRRTPNKAPKRKAPAKKSAKPPKKTKKSARHK